MYPGGTRAGRGRDRHRRALPTLTIPGTDTTDVNTTLKEKGGVPGQVNVMFNGACVAFPDAVPEIVNNRTMVPVRAVMETMGAKVDYAATGKTVSITMNGATVSFPIGGDTMTVTKDGTTTTKKMDTAAYIKQAGAESRTMVPVRFLSEASGYEVLWDNDFRTAVVVDTAALAKKIDSQFTAFNSMLAAQLKAQTGKKMEGEATFQGNLVLTSAKTGSATYGISGTMKTYTDGTSVLMQGTYNLDGLYQLLTQQTDLLKEMNVSLTNVLKDGMKAFQCTLLVDKDGGYYVNVPLLSAFLGTENTTWIKIADLGDLLSSAATDGMTIGQAMVAGAESAGDTGSFYLYSSLEQSGSMMAALFGDSLAKTSGDTTTWTLDKDGIFKTMGTTAAELGVNGLNGSMSLSKSGGYTMKGDVNMTLPAADSTAAKQTLTASLDASGDSAKGQMTMKAAVSGLFSLDISGTDTTKTVTTLPSMTLPAGAQVTNLEDLLGGL